MPNNIERIVLSGYDQDGELTAPAGVYLELFVINGTVTLRGRPGGDIGWSSADDALWEIDVPGKSLLIALKAALRENEDDVLE